MKLGEFELDTIYTGDARTLAEGIPDNSIRMVFVDPPYWVNFDYGEKTDREMDYISPDWMVKTSMRVSEITLITPGHRTLWDYPRPDWMLVWRKGNSMKRYAWGFGHSEPILCYGKPKLSMSKMRPDVFDAPIVVEKHTHACPKPLRLMLQLIETYTEPGDIVADFFVGSGTTAIACKMLGRHYLAFELDPVTADKARQRIQNTQPPLFVTPPRQDAFL